ncbi:MAG: LacI family DNA-binding transcriptional regulator [Thermomicrobiales bacterium]|nr:LacI family DNA-binding transcriptional regulator [Thermomicrobiales bacterium]
MGERERTRRGRAAGATIEDVARASGVSISTVSRIINGRAGAAGAATRERVQAAITQLDYVPNRAARSLKTGRSHLIGVLLADISHPYWGMVLGGVEDACQQRGYGAVVSGAAERVDLENRYLTLFLSQQVDGILLNPAHADAGTIAAWSRLTVPIVSLDRTLPGLPFDLVAMDNERGMRLAVEHLAALGHHRIGFVSWEPGDYSNRLERLAGYRAALVDASLPATDDLVRFARMGWEDGVRATAALLAQPQRPTAVISASSMLNLQVLAAAKRLGLRVPEDLSVVGHDDAPWDDLLDPPLTTIATPARELGALAAVRLIAAIEADTPARGGERRLEPRLALRRSTAPPASG